MSRFFVLHFLLAIVVLLLALIHILILHANGSTSPEVRNSGWSGQGGFAYFFVFKDMQIVVAAFLVLFYLSLIIPNYLNHSDNFIEANPLVTPTHIVPEWYFLTFYAMLRAVPNKLGGAGVLALSLLFLAILPALARGYSRYELSFSDYRGPSAPFVAIFVFLSALLGYLGAQEAVEPFIVCSQLACLHYFMVLLFRMALSQCRSKQ